MHAIPNFTSSAAPSSSHKHHSSSSTEQPTSQPSDQPATPSPFKSVLQSLQKSAVIKSTGRSQEQKRTSAADAKDAQSDQAAKTAKTNARVETRDDAAHADPTDKPKADTQDESSPDKAAAIHYEDVRPTEATAQPQPAEPTAADATASPTAKASPGSAPVQAVQALLIPTTPTKTAKASADAFATPQDPAPTDADSNDGPSAAAHDNESSAPAPVTPQSSTTHQPKTASDFQQQQQSENQDPKSPANSLPIVAPPVEAADDLKPQPTIQTQSTQDPHTPHPQAPTLSTLDQPSAAAHQASANAAAPAQDSPRIDPQSTLDQVVLGLRGKIDAKNQSAEIHLEPQNLGSVHVSINVSNGILTADFQTANPLVHDLLSSQLDKLKNALEGQGITVDRLSVTTEADKTAALPLPSSAGSNGPDVGNPNHDGRSAGNFGYRGQQQSPQRDQNAPSFATAWKQAKAPIDLVA